MSQNQSTFAHQGRLYIISAPSGAGKTSLVAALLKADSAIEVSISHTTRKSRPGEQDGINYHFVDVPAFEQLISEGAFLEHAKVFDHYYGTSKAEITRITSLGCDVILEIDWQGAKQILKRYPEQAVSIFILPPSLKTLKERLEKRGISATIRKNLGRDIDGACGQLVVQGQK